MRHKAQLCNGDSLGSWEIRVGGDSFGFFGFLAIKINQPETTNRTTNVREHETIMSFSLFCEFWCVVGWCVWCWSLNIRTILFFYYITTYYENPNVGVTGTIRLYGWSWSSPEIPHANNILIMHSCRKTLVAIDFSRSRFNSRSTPCFRKLLWFQNEVRKEEWECQRRREKSRDKSFLKKAWSGTVLLWWFYPIYKYIPQPIPVVEIARTAAFKRGVNIAKSQWRCTTKLNSPYWWMVLKNEWIHPSILLLARRAVLEQGGPSE